jgi:NAD+ kinase
MKIGIIANKNYSKEIGQFFRHFLDWLKKNHIDFCVEAEFAELAAYPNGKALFDILNEADLLLILGGDGTILRAARVMGDKQIPMLGIRFGRLGFLAELSGKTFEMELKTILSGKYRVDERMVLEAQITPGNDIYYAMNDFVVLRAPSSKILTTEVHVDDVYMNTFRSDGLIIASPTGSTAYSLSAFGPILTPGINAMIINPICPHMLSNRPTVLSGDCVIRIWFKELSDGCVLSVDGQEDLPVTPDTEILVRKAAHNVKLVRSVNSNFFSVVRNKLKWTQ